MDPTIVTAATTALATTVCVKSLESPLKSLNDLWDGAIGHHISAWSESRRIQAFENVSNFKQNLADETNKIPFENVQEPQISIVGPTLEASKYYMDEDQLRLMFAKVIASSMDSRKNGYVQHSFVEIIKQLTPLDAEILSCIDVLEPIVNLSVKQNSSNDLTSSKGSKIIYKDLFIHPQFLNNSLNSISINNLSRLGLINVTYERYITQQDIYQPFNNTEEYLYVENLCKGRTPNEESLSPDIAQGIVEITNFGKAFKDICV